MPGVIAYQGVIKAFEDLILAIKSEGMVISTSKLKIKEDMIHLFTTIDDVIIIKIKGAKGG